MLGVRVGLNDANKAWAAKRSITYPLLNDSRRQMTKAYGVLRDDRTMLENPQQIEDYWRTQRAWGVIEEGVRHYVKVTEPRTTGNCRMMRA